MQIAVVGIGERLRGDDGAGPTAVQLWQAQHPATACRPDVRIVSGELPGLELLDELDGADAVVVVDAIQSGAAPGSLHRLDLDQLSAFASDSKSCHGWGVVETLQLGRLLNPIGRNMVVRIVGIEAGRSDVGCGLSESVERALPQASEVIQAETEALLRQ